MEDKTQKHLTPEQVKELIALEVKFENVECSNIGFLNQYDLHTYRLEATERAEWMFEQSESYEELCPAPSVQEIMDKLPSRIYDYELHLFASSKDGNKVWVVGYYDIYFRALLEVRSNNILIATFELLKKTMASPADCIILNQ